MSRKREGARHSRERASGLGTRGYGFPTDRGERRERLRLFQETDGRAELKHVIWIRGAGRLGEKRQGPGHRPVLMGWAIPAVVQHHPHRVPSSLHDNFMVRIEQAEQARPADAQRRERSEVKQQRPPTRQKAEATAWLPIVRVHVDSCCAPS